MNKKFLLCLASIMVLAGCGNDKPSDSSSSEEVDNKNYYATINSKYDVVHVYGIVGESFDLSTINYANRFEGEPKISIDDNVTGIKVNGRKIDFLEKGIYSVKIMFGDWEDDSFELKILVNDNEENRYAYPEDLDLSAYTLQSGLEDDVTVEENAITLKGRGATWNRVTYDLLPEYSTNYTLECDITFLQTENNDSSRWCGLVFRDQETDAKKSPYFQFDFRQNSALSNAVEVTYVYSDANYSYPYTGTWENGGPGIMNVDSIHAKFSLQDAMFTGELSYGEHKTQVNLVLPTTTNGNIGFQCAGSTVKFENIKISLDGSEKLSSTADSNTSKVNINDEAVDSLKPHMIASGLDIDEIYGVYENDQQFYVKLKGNQTYTINDELMDDNLNSLFDNLRGDFIPNLQIEDENTLNKAVEICKSYGIIDLVIWSENGDILDKARSLMPYARLGYIPTNIQGFETFDEIGPICREAGSHYANLILIDSDILNKENISKTVGLGYSVVANAKDGANYSVISSALAGCKLILARYNKDVQAQANKLYDPTIFNVTANAHSLFSVPYATGHRGAGNDGENINAKLPENTVPSFKYAYDHGALSIEIDIHETADHRLAVIHDADTSPYSNQRLVVRQSTLAQLQALPLKTGTENIYSSNYHIPSLEEVFDAFKGEEYKDRTIVIEVKDNTFNTGKMAIELAKEMNWYNRITLITFNSATAKQLKDYDPGIQVGYLGTVSRATNDAYWSSVNSYLANGVGLASQFMDVSKEALQESNARGYMYWFWTFGYYNAADIITAINNGNRAFTVNYIEFFSENKYKLTCDETITLGNNETKTLTATSETYTHTKTNEDKVEIIVLTDNATANGNQLTRTGDGDIKIVFKLKTSWKVYQTNPDYYIYSEIVTIK